jgi:hypothetical protein
MAMRNHAALAPNRPQGNTPALSSFFNTSLIRSTLPAFSRCHWISFLHLPVEEVRHHGKVFDGRAIGGKLPLFLRIRNAM